MPGRVMVLDAEPVVRSTIADILTRGGYAVEPVATLDLALESIRQERPALLLTNVYLPGVTGRDAVRRVKEACPELPVLMVSGLPDEDVIHQWAGKNGFDTFPKPFTAQELIDKVRSILAD
jgi:DNA-binding response OmpR family regulator